MSLDHWPTMDWRETSPETQGIDSALLRRAEASMRQHWPYIQSLLVIRHGHLVWETYFGGHERDHVWDAQGKLILTDPYPASYHRDQLHDLRSVTKSILSALIGIAVREGFLDSLDRPALDFLGKHIMEIDDPRKRDITIRHLLMMRSGFQWDESGAGFIAWAESRDLIAHHFKLPLAAAPGQRWCYSTGDSQLLGAVLTNATGKTALEFADHYLFKPLNITERRWTLHPQGYYIGGGLLYLKPRDMAKFGYLYLNDGLWENRPIVPREWVKLTTARQSDVNGDVIRASSQNPDVIPPNVRYYPEGYGFHWWHTSFNGVSCYYAAGYGGQYIFVMPELDLVVVETASADIRPEDLTYARSVGSFQLVDNFVIPAISKR